MSEPPNRCSNHPPATNTFFGGGFVLSSFSPFGFDFECMFFRSYKVDRFGSNVVIQVSDVRIVQRTAFHESLSGRDILLKKMGDRF